MNKNDMKQIKEAVKKLKIIKDNKDLIIRKEKDGDRELMLFGNGGGCIQFVLGSGLCENAFLGNIKDTIRWTLFFNFSQGNVETVKEYPSDWTPLFKTIRDSEGGTSNIVYPVERNSADYRKSSDLDTLWANPRRWELLDYLITNLELIGE